jgi:DNA topoisomerase VI subunit B
MAFRVLIELDDDVEVAVPPPPRRPRVLIDGDPPPKSRAPSQRARTAPHHITRETFSTSRLLEFCSERELVTQTGHAVAEWLLVILKELVDNGVDSAEEVNITPRVTVTVDTETGTLVFTDNAGGIPSSTVDAICDYTVRASSREAYVSPTRGAQGNALKTIIAMPFVLDSEIGETVCIESQGVAHHITFAVDAIRQEPRITLVRAASSVKTGTRITVHWPKNACHLMIDGRTRFLQIIGLMYCFNPHLRVRVTWDGQVVVDYKGHFPAWRKWRPSDAFVVHWYSPERFQRLIAACVNADQQHGRMRLVSDFLAQFRGFKGSANRKLVLDEIRLTRAPLDTFFISDTEIDEAAITRLRQAMLAVTNPVPPKALGIIGEEHWRQSFLAQGADMDTFRYAKVLDDVWYDDGTVVPFVVEAAFAFNRRLQTRMFRTGLNWSPSLGRLFGTETVDALNAADTKFSDPISVFLHVATPVVQFTDRGKADAVVSRACMRAVDTVITRVVTAWAKAARKREDQATRAYLSRERAIRAQEPKKQRWKRDNSYVGTGPVHRATAAAADSVDAEIQALFVLSKDVDPANLDTVAGHIEAAWFRDQVNRFAAHLEQIHLRALFYMVVGAGDVRRPRVHPANDEGPIVTNSHKDWRWFLKTAKYTRWLVDDTGGSYVPFSRISDNRNREARYIAYADTPHVGTISVTAGDDIDLPNFESLLPTLTSHPPGNRQPFRLAFVTEKFSIADELDALAQEVKADLVPMTGESSYTRIAEMAARAAADGRELIVLYFSDFDPQGFEMPIDVAYWLHLLRIKEFPNLRWRMIQAALTLEQAEKYNLPATPLKASEKRRDRWLERMGREQTEIDALMALEPGALEEIAREELIPFYDFTLDRRCQEVMEQWRKGAQAKLDRHPEWPNIRASIEEAHQAVIQAVGELNSVQQYAVELVTEGEDGTGDIEIAIPDVIVGDAQPDVLASSEDDFVTLIRKLQDGKAYLTKAKGDKAEDDDELDDDDDQPDDEEE